MSRAVNQNSPTFESKQNLLALGKQRLDFRLSRDKVVHRETAANACASHEKILKRMKIKVTGPTGNSENCFLLPCKTHCFPWSQSLVTYFTDFARCLY